MSDLSSHTYRILIFTGEVKDSFPQSDQYFVFCQPPLDMHFIKIRYVLLFLVGNQLNGLPASIKSLQELTVLDVSENKYLDNLPVNICFLRKIEVRIFFIPLMGIKVHRTPMTKFFQ